MKPLHKKYKKEFLSVSKERDDRKRNKKIKEELNEIDNFDSSLDLPAYDKTEGTKASRFSHWKNYRYVNRKGLRWLAYMAKKGKTIDEVKAELDSTISFEDISYQFYFARYNGNKIEIKTAFGDFVPLEDISYKMVYVFENGKLGYHEGKPKKKYNPPVYLIKQKNFIYFKKFDGQIYKVEDKSIPLPSNVDPADLELLYAKDTKKIKASSRYIIVPDYKKVYGAFSGKAIPISTCRQVKGKEITKQMRGLIEIPRSY
jgi:hypothetical protein